MNTFHKKNSISFNKPYGGVESDNTMVADRNIRLLMGRVDSVASRKNPKLERIQRADTGNLLK